MEAILTVRLDSEVKRKGTQVMEKMGLTPSQAVRKLFDYAASTDSLPFGQEEKLSKAQVRKRIAAFDRCHTKVPLEMSDEEIRYARLSSRYEIDD